jgi:hypothetical protein
MLPITTTPFLDFIKNIQTPPFCAEKQNDVTLSGSLLKTQLAAEYERPLPAGQTTCWEGREGRNYFPPLFLPATAANALSLFLSLSLSLSLSLYLSLLSNSPSLSLFLSLSFSLSLSLSLSHTLSLSVSAGRSTAVPAPYGPPPPCRPYQGRSRRTGRASVTGGRKLSYLEWPREKNLETTSTCVYGFGCAGYK